MRPAAWRFGVLVSLVACWTEPRPATPIEHRVAPSHKDFAGLYSCSIDDGYQYPPFRCEIRRDGKRLVLVKLGGSQRFEGVIQPFADDSGFAFRGTFYCPFGDCTQELHGEFRNFPPAERVGVLRGAFRDARFTVLLVPDAGDGFGGSEYGGAGYGMQIP